MNSDAHTLLFLLLFFHQRAEEQKRAQVHEREMQLKQDAVRKARVRSECATSSSHSDPYKSCYSFHTRRRLKLMGHRRRQRSSLTRRTTTTLAASAPTTPPTTRYVPRIEAAGVVAAPARAHAFFLLQIHMCRRRRGSRCPRGRPALPSKRRSTISSCQRRILLRFSRPFPLPI
jgi:hypothetical protein